MPHRIDCTFCAATLATIVFASICNGQVIEQDEAAPKAAAESQKVIVPLDQIWTNDMPGTRDVAELIAGQSHDLVDDILNSLVTIGEEQTLKNQPAKPSFVVQGGDLVALRNAQATFKTGKASNIVAADSDATVVFFMHIAGHDVQLQNVERVERKITIQYRLVGYAERGFSARFALIPLGKLPAGKYEVNLQQLPAMQRLGETYRLNIPLHLSSSADMSVSRPFKFEVREQSVTR